MTSIEDNLSALLGSTALVLVGIVLTSVSRIVERVVVARFFSPSVYGEVAMGLAVLSIGSTISLVGLNHGIPRYLSRFDDERDLRGTWFVGIVASVITGTVVSAALLANIDRIASLLFDGVDSTGLLRLFVIAVPVNVGVTVGIATLRGMENTQYKLVAKNVLQPGLRLLIMVGLLASGVGLISIGYAYLAAAAVTLVVAHLFANRLFSLVGPVRTHFRELATFSAPLIVTMLLSVLLTRTDTLMLGYFASSATAGIYNAAYPLANSLLLVVSAFGYLYLPLTSRLDAENKRGEVSEIYRLTTKWGYVVTFPAFLVFTVFPGDVVTLFFGGEYVDAAVPLAILSLGFFTSAAAGRNRSTLSALGHTKHILAVDVVTILLNVGLNVLLIPAYSYVGAAVASAAAYVLRNVAIYAVLHIKCSITLVSRRMVTVYGTLPLTLVPLSLALSQWLTLTAITLPAFLVVAGLACLVVVALAGCLEPKDALIVDFIEDSTGLSVPLVHRHIPEQTPIRD